MQSDFSRPRRNPLNRKSENGYILVTLTLFVALLAIAAAAIAPTLTFQIKRDREEEMVHRGVQYSRAIQKYFKKFGRYPTSLTDLENTNNLRFLRKRYKDPVTGKDFRLLHYGEVQMMGMGAGMAGGTPAAAMAGAGMPGSLMQGSSATGSSMSGSPLAGSANPGFTLGSNGTQSTAGSTIPGNTPADGTSDANSPGDSGPTTGTSASSTSQIIGGPIVGVISLSKAKSIREYSGKDHYNQWQFIYDPGTAPRVGLITTPSQPQLQNTIANPASPTMGTPASALGSSSFGSNTNSATPQTTPGAAPSQNPPTQ